MHPCLPLATMMTLPHFPHGSHTLFPAGPHRAAGVHKEQVHKEKQEARSLKRGQDARLWLSSAAEALSHLLLPTTDRSEAAKRRSELVS